MKIAVETIEYEELVKDEWTADGQRTADSSGTMTWCPFNSRLNSSTRTELGAAILTLLAPIAAHIGIDNAAVVKTGGQIIEHLRRRAKERWFDDEAKRKLGSRASSLHKPTPFKERWAMMKNGDLWEVFAKIVQRRGPESVTISKVKGHATDEMVQEGQVRRADKKGQRHGGHGS